MTEERYVITEDQYEKLLDTCKTGAEIGVLNEVYRQPLSTELRKERERVLDDLINWIRIADDDSDHVPWKFKEINKCIIAFNKEVSKRESLRGEL